MAVAVKVPVEQRHGADGGSHMGDLSVGAVLQDDSIRSLSHGPKRGVLQSSYSSAGRESIKENNLKESLDIREESHDVVQELGRQLVANGARFS